MAIAIVKNQRMHHCGLSMILSSEVCCWVTGQEMNCQSVSDADEVLLCRAQVEVMSRKKMLMNRRWALPDLVSLCG